MKSGIFQNVLLSPYNITNILITLKPLLKYLYEKVCNEKVNMERHQKIYIFTEELEQNTYTESKKAHSLLEISQRFIF